MTPFALHLLRHGAPETPGRMNGWTDCAPTAEGVAACRAQAAGLAFEALVSSDLGRAQTAGEAIGEAAGMPLTLDHRWRELHFGDWDGLAPSAIDDAALARFWGDPDACPPPNGESWSALTDRVSAALRALAPRPTLVVTHGGAMRAAFAWLCGLDHRRAWALDLPYAALLSLRVWPGETWTAQVTGLRP